MPTLTFDGITHSLAPGETVLDGLLRNGADIRHQCRAGACQSCLLRCVEGTAPAAAQQGLKSTLRAQGYFLSCIAKPAADLTVARADDAITSVRARIEHVEKLTPDVARVKLRCAAPFDYKPGQFVSVIRDDGLSRSYSVASLPDRDEWIELHVRKIPGGQMSNWLYDHPTEGELVELRGPGGDCFYVEGNPDQPLLLVGTGTGLAPLYAILQDALRNHHRAPIHLFHGAPDADRLYLVDELQALAATHPNVHYTRCLMTGQETDGVCVGDIEKIVLTATGPLKGFRAYLCGNPALVQTLRKKVFLAGASLRDIHSDAFVPATASAPAPAIGPA